MKNIRFYISLGMSTCFYGGIAAQAPKKQLNIVFIMTDDHAFQALSAYGHPISKLAPTPNLDRMAKV